ncbi:DUF1178 family protein [Celeribacter indicus]|uniref:Uncharacterized protein n=1 Tax=Celeribacter indicus TaxID=1208324 RepID=A0A0B5DZ14_9RHOB|nr:DUF1178 family protein [Celeribacter indicus]AJE45966.1 hypothetical protein P73_1251 [Celeribacter indicus]SDW64956.1 hypothetical protein SAMN05443573_105198 [Celeribacter indicus]
MIRYTLKCANDHRFESWFRSAEDYEAQTARGLVGCPDCGETRVGKAMMAPQVCTAREEAPAGPPPPVPAQTAPTPEQIEQAIAKLRAEVEANSDYVGLEFAAEARRMHEGAAPPRAIYGETKPDEARKLIEDGVPVLPLPFTPRRKMN